MALVRRNGKIRIFGDTVALLRNVRDRLKEITPRAVFSVSGRGDVLTRIFYCGKTLLIADTVPSFDPETGKWCIVSRNDSDEPCCLEEYAKNEEDDSDEPYYAEKYAKNEAEEFQKYLLKIGESAECNRAVFLIREKEFGRDEKAATENADFILRYNGKNIADKLSSLCESRE